MIAHLAWVALLYVVLTVVRAPSVWGIGRRADGQNPWADVEPRVSANLSNQFEWPLFFHIACVLMLTQSTPIPSLTLGLAWVFVAGRVIHSVVQIGTANVRLRGAVFTVNFLAVLGLWVGVWHQFMG